MQTVTHAFVTSTLDYGNSLLYGMPAYQIMKLQRVQNAAARIVLKLKKFDHIMEGLKSLHCMATSKSKDGIQNWHVYVESTKQYGTSLYP